MTVASDHATPPVDDERDARIDAAIAAYHQAPEAGASPDLLAWIAGQPDLAPDLENYFHAVGMLDALIDASVQDGPRGAARIGSYRIIRVLGRGGMGVVYEVEHEVTGRRYALKRLLLSLEDSRSRQRFEREIATVAQLDHPNIIPLHDSGEWEGLLYYVMPLISGTNLRAVLHQLRSAPFGAGEAHAGNLPDAPPALVAGSGLEYWRAVARIVSKAARGLEHAHQHGVLHRDIKPSNLLLDRQGQVYLTDFGVARTTTHPDLTETGELAGALRFVAPERFHRWCDPRNDIYSLGLVLYELLTLRRAFDAPDRVQLIEAILHDSPPRPRRIDRTIPRDLQNIVLKCIEKEPGHRYPSAEALAGDLECFLEGKPILSRRVGPPAGSGHGAGGTRRRRSRACWGRSCS